MSVGNLSAGKHRAALRAKLTTFQALGNSLAPWTRPQRPDDQLVALTLGCVTQPLDLVSHLTSASGLGSLGGVVLASIFASPSLAAQLSISRTLGRCVQAVAFDLPAWSSALNRSNSQVAQPGNVADPLPHGPRHM